MLLNFRDYGQKAIKFYKRVVREMNASDDPDYSDRLVTCVLRVIRERVSFRESLRILSLLPMHLKGIYVHGWKLNHEPKRLLSEQDFLDGIRITYPHTSGRQPGTEQKLREEIKGIFTVLQQEASAKGIADVSAFLPGVLKKFCCAEDHADSTTDRGNVSEQFPETLKRINI